MPYDKHHSLSQPSINTMLNFIYDHPTRLIFGRQTHQCVGAELRNLPGPVLLHYGSGSIVRTGLHGEIVRSLTEAGIAFFELGGVKPNPSLAKVEEGIALCRRHGIRTVLAVGGGSVIDSAKAIALGTPLEGNVWDLFLSKQPPTRQPLAVATVLTIPAAGSESSPNSVITNEAEQRKLGYGHPLLRPAFSIVDPELFVTLPANQLAYGVCDMMSHIFERYFTNTTHTDLTDTWCEGALRTIMHNALLLRRNSSDVEAWAQIGLSGSMAHNNILGIGREQDWACHAMEHELSAAYDVPHGAGLAVVTPAWMRYVAPAHEGIFVQFAVNAMGVSGALRDRRAIIEEGIRSLERFYTAMGLPLTMEQLGIPRDADFEALARAAISVRGPIGGLQKLDAADVLAIYKAADRR